MMKKIKAALVFCFAALALFAATPARADNFDKLTYLTFSKTVELPGNVTLPPGEYAFTVMTTMGYRHIVQVFNKDRTHLYATILAIPNYHPKVSEKTVITFAESASGAPNAIKEWFYPGQSYGQEFVYPKNRAVELAKAANEPVPAMPEELASDVTKPATTETVQEMEKAPLKAEEPTGQEAEVTQEFAVTPNGGEKLQAALPKTASPAPLMALGGMLLAITGVILWKISKRTAS